MQTNNWLKILLSMISFFHRECLFLKTRFISALMIVVNLLLLSSFHRCFVSLFSTNLLIPYWRKIIEHFVLSFCFVFLFVLNVIVFVCYGLKQMMVFSLEKINLSYWMEIVQNTFLVPRKQKGEEVCIFP